MPIRLIVLVFAVLFSIRGVLRPVHLFTCLKKSKAVQNDTTTKKPCALELVEHTSSRSKEFPRHVLSIYEKIVQVVGPNAERFMRKVSFSSVIREESEESTHSGIVRLSAFLRNVVCRAQLFVNRYILSHANRSIPIYVYSQNFWSSICQLVLGLPITNSNSKVPMDIQADWQVFCAQHPQVVFPLTGVSGYSDALAATCMTLATAYTSHWWRIFQSRVCHYIMRTLQNSVPILSRKGAKALAFEYIYERVADGEASWPRRWVDIVSIDTWKARCAICDDLSALIPAPATQQAMSASPGAYIPVLWHILHKYDEEYQDAKTFQLPRLFSLTPLLSFAWRFVTINAKALRCMTFVGVLGSGYNKNLRVFDSVFKLDKFGL